MGAGAAQVGVCLRGRGRRRQGQTLTGKAWNATAASSAASRAPMGKTKSTRCPSVRWNDTEQAQVSMPLAGAIPPHPCLSPPGRHPARADRYLSKGLPFSWNAGGLQRGAAGVLCGLATHARLDFRKLSVFQRPARNAGSTIKHTKYI